MTTDGDHTQELAATVKGAAEAHTPLAIQGSGSKRFYTGELPGKSLDVTGHRGIVTYEPTELVITARAGTPLHEIEMALAEKNQMLAFEPPYFGDGATLGGAIACGLSGPRRPYAGSARDFVLGVTMINGNGEVLRFGGQVMKNVAGYDISRLMAGSLGTLGVILDVSLKVLPKPACEVTLVYAMDATGAIERMNALAGQPLPLSATCHVEGKLYVRLSGSEKGVHAAQTKLGGDVLPTGENFWRDLREQRLAFFRNDTPLWRLSLPPAMPPLDLPGSWLIDWGGAQRWLLSDAASARIHDAATRAGGHAMAFRLPPGGQRRFDQLDAVSRALHARLQQAFDPRGVFGGARLLAAA